ncbi:MAG: hypothetical protein ABI891_13255 [Acidobacteriota bacterium]
METHFQSVFAYLLVHLNQLQKTIGVDHLIDSMPVMLAMGGKSKRAKSAVAYLPQIRQNLRLHKRFAQAEIT